MFIYLFISIVFVKVCFYFYTIEFSKLKAKQMLRLTIVIACLMSLLCFSKVSFQQDPLETFAINNSCLNGAIYIENKCICLPQYTGINCEILISSSTTTTTTTTATISNIQNSILNGFTDGLINFISYYFNLQGLGDLNTLSAEDIQILAKLYVSSLINETNLFIYSINNNQSSPFVNLSDLSLQEKISHLTQNIMFIIDLLTMSKLTYDTDSSSAAKPINIEQIFIDLIIICLNNLEMYLNLPQNNDLNRLLAYNLMAKLTEHKRSKRSLIDLNVMSSVLNSMLEQSIPKENINMNKTINNGTTITAGFSFKLNNLFNKIINQNRRIKKRSNLLKKIFK
jgi:hypothetical protein